MNRPLVIILGIMCFVYIIVIIIRKCVPLRFLKSHHEVAFPIFLQIGVIYAVFLAFVFSLEWGEYVGARENVQKEAGCLLILMHFAQAFPAPYNRIIENDLINYTHYIIQVDWNDMRYKRARLNTWGRLSHLQTIYLDFNPKTKQENYFYLESLRNLEKLREYRQMRIFKVQEIQPTELWITLILLGSCIVLISLLFGMRYLWTQAILVSALAGIIATLIIVTLALSTPFSGRYSLKPIEFENISSKFFQMEEINKDSSDSQK